MGTTHSTELTRPRAPGTGAPRMKSKLLAVALSTSLVLAPGSSSLALNTELPELGTSSGSVMTPKQEKDLGRAFMRSVRRNQAVMDDPLVTDYLQQLGEHLVNHSNAAGQRFTFFAIDNPTINAFAGPGGHIGVYTGLIQTTETEAELASVLAHEIAHVTQHHLMRAWETAQNMAIPNAAIMLAAIALGMTVGGDAGIAAAAGGQAALLQQQINFTRANEKEADRIGIDILAKADFEPRAMPAFFDRMGKANRVYATELPEFLMTHPVTTNRTAEALDRAAGYAYTQPADDLRYQLVRMYLLQRNRNDPNTAIAEFDRMLKDGRYRNRVATEYGRARALMRAGQLTEAERAVDSLLQERPDMLDFVVAKASLEVLRGDTQAALQRLDSALLKKPSSYALNVQYAEVALARGRYAAVLSHLQRYIEFNDQDPRIYALLSRAAGETGHTVDAHLYQAEHHYLNGDLDSAILQLEIALKTPGIRFFDSSRVESRLKTLQDEEAENKKRE